VAKFKLDENLGKRGQEMFAAVGHDACTVLAQKLQGATDEELFAACGRERRCLVTLDLDFASPLRFPPKGSPGIIVLPLPAQPSHQLLCQSIQNAINALKKEAIEDTLWIVEPGRIRIHLELE
jgi:predicted nuclease of predicted toxin-antitoxin system